MSGNQHQPDPRQAAFLAYYLDPKSGTFGNAKQSAIKANYSEEYADNIMSLLPDWLSDNIGRLKMLNKAEQNLEKFLNDEDDKRIQADITKFVAERLGKNRYSTKQEVDSKVEISGSIDITKASEEELQKIINS